ncbi:MAG: carbohydrate binding domain-containing protein, partial [Nitrososphaera sp.]|nr:carbohydrate binding domain-containing protein [Nitrososphaera sp.]
MSLQSATSSFLTNGGFESGQLTPWVFQNYPNLATATITSASGEYQEGTKGLQVNITGLDQFWSIQVRQQFAVTQQQHTIKFWAKAASNRTMTVDAQDGGGSWTNLGLWQTVNLTTSWQQFTFTFTPPAGYPNGVIHFYLGEAMPTVWIDGVELTTAGGQQQPVLSLSPTVVDLDSTKNTRSFVVSNTGNGTLSWSASESSTALSLSVSSGTAPVSDTVTVSLNRSQAAFGIHVDTVLVTSNGGNSSVIVRYKVVPPSNNLLTNGGFESGQLIPWVFQNYPNLATATIISASGEYQEGTKGLRVDITGLDQFWSIQIRQQFSVTQQQHTIKFWAKAASNRTITMDAQDGGGSWTNLGLWQTINLTTSWQHFTFMFTPPAGYPNGVIHFYLGEAMPTVWIDGVELTTAGAQQVPVLFLSPTVVDLDSTKNTGSFVISNTGGGALNWNATETSAALSLSLLSGAAPPNAAVTVNLDRNQTTLGIHTDTVKVTSNGGSGNVVVRYKKVPVPSNILANGGFESGAI